MQASPIQDVPEKSFGNVTQSHIYDPASKIKLNSSIKRVKFDDSALESNNMSRNSA